MRQFLRNFVAWLDTRFPERVVVTQAEFLALKAKIKELEASQMTEERIRKIEAEINKFNVSLGFGGTLAKTLAPFQR